MPKVILTEENRIKDRLYKDYEWALDKAGYKQKHLAAILGVSQPAVSKKFRNQTLTLDDLIRIYTATGVEIHVSNKTIW